MAKLRITQVRSVIGRPADQKATMVAIGLRKMNQVVEKEVTPQILGMIKKVNHLISVKEI